MRSATVPPLIWTAVNGRICQNINSPRTGDRGVVLAYGGRFDKESWRKQALLLARAGFRILAIGFRGEGQSRGGTAGRPAEEGHPFGVLAAVHYLRETGAKSVSVAGASMGGDYAAEAAEAEPAQINRVVLLSVYDDLSESMGVGSKGLSATACAGDEREGRRIIRESLGGGGQEARRRRTRTVIASAAASGCFAARSSIACA